MTVYYNEIDPFAAQWLRNLIDENLIAPGEVDERDIRDIKPSELAEYTQCHFFAGIGGWSLALRLAGWPDDKPVWTGSCPCQPFSAAGCGAGFADERHLWPAWFHLIRECRPGVIFGEQVEAAIKHGWLDLVQSDLEGEGYAVAAVGIPAAVIGAPHIRQRLWFVADTDSEQHHRARDIGARRGDEYSIGCAVGNLADTAPGGRREECPDPGRDAIGDGAQGLPAGFGASGGDLWAGPLNGFWRNADWLHCRDGKWRPVEPGAQQMVDGVSRAMGLLRTDNPAKKEVDDAAKAVGLADQVLRALRCGHATEAVWRSLGRRIGLPEATLLLAVVCEQSRELGRVFDGQAAGGAQERQAGLRALRESATSSACPSQGRESEQQLAWELGDTLPELSQACPSTQRHLDQLRQFSGSPLAVGIPNRVGRLRAYGNAINPWVAAEFIRAFDGGVAQ